MKINMILTDLYLENIRLSLKIVYKMAFIFYVQGDVMFINVRIS